MSLVAASQDIDVTSEYLNRLKTQDHHVQHAEVVRFAREVAKLRTHARQLEMQKTELSEQDERSRQTLVQVRQMVVDRDAEMAAWAQQLYDDVGKARADLARAQRNFEVERLELQSQCMNLESRVTDGEAGAEAEQAKSDVQRIQLANEVAMAREAQKAAQQQRDNAEQASAEAKQKLLEANADREAALQQALQARTEQQQAKRAQIKADKGKAEALDKVKSADQERDAALKSREANAMELDTEREAKLVAQQDKDTAEGALATAQQSNAQQAQQIASLRQQLNQVQAHLESTQAERDTMVVRGTQMMQDHIAALKKDAEQHAKALAQQQDKHRADAEQHTKAAAEQQEELKQAHAALSEEHGKLKDAQDALAAASAEASTAEAAQAELRSEVAGLKADLQALQTSGQEAQQEAEQRLEALTAQLKAATSEKEAAEGHTEAAKQGTVSLQQAVDKLKVQLQQAQASLKDAEGKLNSEAATTQETNQLRMQAEQALTVEAQAKKQAESKLDTSKEECTQLQQALAASQHEEAKLKKQLKADAAKSRQLAEELESSAARVNELTSLLSDAQLQFDRAERHRASALRQLDAQEEDFGRLGRHLQKAGSPALSSRPPSSKPEVSPRRISRRDQDLLEVPTAKPSAEKTDAAPHASQADLPAAAPGASVRTPAEPDYRGSSDEEGDADMAGDDEQDESAGSDTSEISLAGTPQAAQPPAESKPGLFGSIVKTASKLWSSPKPAAKPDRPSGVANKGAQLRPEWPTSRLARSTLATTSTAVPGNDQRQTSPAVAGPAQHQSQMAPVVLGVKSKDKGAKPGNKDQSAQEPAGAESKSKKRARELEQPQDSGLPESPQEPADAPRAVAKKRARKAETVQQSTAHESACELLESATRGRRRERKAASTQDLGDPGSAHAAGEPEGDSQKRTSKATVAQESGEAADAAQPRGRTLLAAAAATALPQTEQKPLKASVEQSPEVQKLFETYKAAVGGVTNPDESPEAKRRHAGIAAELAEAVVIGAAVDAAQHNSSAQAATTTTRKRAGRSNRSNQAVQQQLQQEAAPLSCAAEEEEKEAAKPAADYEAAPSIKKKPGRASKAQKLRSEQEQAMLQGSSKLEGGEVSNPMDAVKEEGAAAAPTAAQQDVEKKETRARAPGRRTTSGTTARSNATGIKSGRIIKAVSGASKGTGRRSSVKAPAVHATVRNLRSRSVVTTDSQDPEMVDDTAGSKPRSRRQKKVVPALDIINEEDNAE